MKTVTKSTLALATLATAIFATTAVNAELVISQNGKAIETSNTVTKAAADAAARSTAVQKAIRDAKANAYAKTNRNTTNYSLDPNHSNVRFAIDHFGTTTNHGGFYGVTGDLAFDPAKRMGAIDVIIPINSLQTGNDHFTNHLKSKDFFNAEQYPNAEFKSTKFYFNGNKLSKVTGNLTMLGKTNPVTLTATKFNCYDSPMLKTQVCGGDFDTTIDRTLWGMDGMVKMGMPKNVKLTIQVEAGKQ